MFSHLRWGRRALPRRPERQDSVMEYLVVLVVMLVLILLVRKD